MSQALAQAFVGITEIVNMAQPLDSFEPNRLEVLKMLYSQQQATAHKLRERLTQIAAAHITLLLAIDGWVLTKSDGINSDQMTMIVLAVILTLVIAVFAIHARYKEFGVIAGMIVRVETAMRVFDRGFYLQDETLYELEHQDLGKDHYTHSMTIFQSHFYALIANSLLTAGIVLAN
ncbi:MAG: hypothetical protein GKR91_08320 [Pseudomonadales bacterium]|nr:hypothetical protein [Pseudomonadales bacterium]